MDINFTFKVDESICNDVRLLELYQEYDDWSKNDLIVYASFLLYIASTK